MLVRATEGFALSISNGVAEEPYYIERRLAAGGMAEVFVAKRVGPHGFEKRVALKRILPQFAVDLMTVSPLGYPLESMYASVSTMVFALGWMYWSAYLMACVLKWMSM
jgi:hypothetical protein